jgi:hypothetical protein
MCTNTISHLSKPSNKATLPFSPCDRSGIYKLTWLLHLVGFLSLSLSLSLSLHTLLTMHGRRNVKDMSVFTAQNFARPRSLKKFLSRSSGPKFIQFGWRYRSHGPNIIYTRKWNLFSTTQILPSFTLAERYCMTFFRDTSVRMGRNGRKCWEISFTPLGKVWLPLYRGSTVVKVLCYSGTAVAQWLRCCATVGPR